ncbi:unnamed protein product [[Candida] boidinii]|uniref:Unnamed protein product n=1 Tax=Candida boidinii TaxID=5477 RepID=A0A9W6T723_CANBO|nr:unnamed protein product [[Candida] boidinii]
MIPTIITGSDLGKQTLLTEVCFAGHAGTGGSLLLLESVSSFCSMVSKLVHNNFVPASTGITFDPQPGQNWFLISQSKYVLEYEKIEASLLDKFNNSGIDFK